MDLWFSEFHSPGVKFNIKVDKHICSVTSAFQRLDIFDSIEFGRVLTLDGILMLTEKDEYIYHEMITHVPMCYSPSAKDVLVIGAGDGGTVRELIKYNTIENIDVAEIDETVVKMCREYFPEITRGFDDKRVNIHFTDGLKFVRKHSKRYDLIIVDSTDPFGPGEGLFSSEFYGSCFDALSDTGIIVNQHESPFYDSTKAMVTKTHQKLKKFFTTAKVYQAHIPTYPSGHWLFGFAAKQKLEMTEELKSDWNSLGITTKYFNTDVLTGSFLLPNNVKILLEK